ncbi:hypothetical protein E3N88_10360 [Mikania micrantha]|uniref:Uncharacterized protein n=1 Tax=Mikania micrantha TaxID=192012 RepID=A0A5N6PBJ3_9ASTR|nr:hypothetical protein E3N88_10360 [Mikania micrantha]
MRTSATLCYWCGLPEVKAYEMVLILEDFRYAIRFQVVARYIGIMCDAKVVSLYVVVVSNRIAVRQNCVRGLLGRGGWLWRQRQLVETGILNEKSNTVIV